MVVGGGEAGVITVLAPPGSLSPGSRVMLDDDECHHLQVRRVVGGTLVRVLDGAGAVGEGELTLGSGTASVHLRSVDLVDPPVVLHLLVAAGDRERFGWLAEKCAELGVTELVPMETERTRPVASRLRAGHLDKLRRRTREAIKQSGAAWAPAVADLLPLEVAIERAASGSRWLADPAGRTPAAGELPVAVAVGPEGGFGTAERDLLVRAGFEPVRLGPHVMRFETAALAAAVLARASMRGTVHE